MQDVAREFPNLTKKLITKSLQEQRKTIENYFSRNATFSHPILYARNRDEILRIYQYWAMFNRELRVVNNECIYDSERDLGFMDSTTFFRPWIAPFLSLHIRVLTFLYFAPETNDTVHHGDQQHQPNKRSGNKVIVMQEDIWDFTSLAVSVCAPVVEPMYHFYKLFLLNWILLFTSLVEAIFGKLGG
ncbi:uncharacterized protein VTP21DRAFT_4277 [Calcarisporiella thermophila]|uniref:uncharacterized protein n=1 Tax=Calcarisporiella thermophila TaxID=911321 RepID=UPI0037435BA8